MTKFVDSLGLKRLVTKIKEAVGKGTWLPVKKGKGERAVEEGIGTALGSYSHAENNATASGDGSHAENNATASGDGSHAEGDDTAANGVFSHSEGGSTIASGNYSHVEGRQAEASGESSHAEGYFTMASGENSHAEGNQTTASEINSHAEGDNTTASGSDSHAEGSGTTASGSDSHAEGSGTTATGQASHAQGCYNYDNPSFIDMVGIGDGDETNQNASVIYVKRDSDGYIDPSDPKNGYQYLLGVGGYQGRNIAEGMKSVQEVIADLEKGVAATETMTVEEIREIMSA